MILCHGIACSFALEMLQKCIATLSVAGHHSRGRVLGRQRRAVLVASILGEPHMTM